MRKTILTAVIGAAGTIIASLAVIYLSNTKMPSDHPTNPSNPNRSHYDNTKIIAGMIIDEISKKPIGQARITIVGRNESDISQDNGNFRIIIHDDSIKAVRLEVSKKHYKIVDLSFDMPNEAIMIQMSREK